MKFVTYKQHRIIRTQELIINPIPTGVIMEIVKPNGEKITNNGTVLSRFDYANKIIFSFNDLEAATIVGEIEKQFLNPKPKEIKFAHLQVNEPKTILIKFFIQEDELQMGIGVTVSKTASNPRSIGICLIEGEMELLRACLKEQYSTSAVKILEEAKVNLNFRNYVFGKLNEK